MTTTADDALKAADAQAQAVRAAKEAADHPSRRRWMVGPVPFADLVCCALGWWYVLLPGIDKPAVYTWILNNIFGGDYFRMRILGPGALVKVLEWGSILFYTFLYWAAIPAVERYRAGPPGSIWPWNSPNPEVRAEYRTLQWRAFWGVVRFHIVIVGLELARYFFLEKRPASYEAMLADPQYRTILPETIPTWDVSLRHLVVAILVVDAGFYWGHRLLHSSPFWYRYHKKHHEYVDTGILAAFHVSVVEAFFTVMLPGGLAVIGQGMHLFDVWRLAFPMILNSVWAHCGYYLPWRFMPLIILPVGSDPERTHDMHHRNGALNLGSGHTYFLWDRIAGSFRSPNSLLTAAELKAARLTSHDVLGGYVKDDAASTTTADANGAGDVTTRTKSE